jgi:hypothetical protein
MPKDMRKLLSEYAKNGWELKVREDITSLDQVKTLGQQEDEAIEASWIRALLIGQKESDTSTRNRAKGAGPVIVDPKGIHIYGALIRGELDLDGIDTKPDYA